jgi:hypothetical protein
MHRVLSWITYIGTEWTQEEVALKVKNHTTSSTIRHSQYVYSIGVISFHTLRAKSIFHVLGKCSLKLDGWQIAQTRMEYILYITQQNA